MVKQTALLPLPSHPARLQEIKGPYNIGPDKAGRLHNASIYMALSSKMDDPVRLIPLEHRYYGFRVSNIDLFKYVVGKVLYVLKAIEVGRIGELVHIDKEMIGMSKSHQVQKV